MNEGGSKVSNIEKLSYELNESSVELALAIEEGGGGGICVCKSGSLVWPT